MITGEKREEWTTVSDEDQNEMLNDRWREVNRSTKYSSESCFDEHQTKNTKEKNTKKDIRQRQREHCLDRNGDDDFPWILFSLMDEGEEEWRRS